MSEEKHPLCRLAEIADEIDALRIRREVGRYSCVKDGETMSLRRPKFYDAQSVEAP